MTQKNEQPQPSKAEIKAAMANEFKQGFAEAQRSAEDDFQQWEGAAKSLGGAAKKIEELIGHVARDVKEKRASQEEAAYARRYLIRASEVCVNLKLKAEDYRSRARGRMEGMSTGGNMAAKMLAEANKQLREQGLPTLAPQAPSQPPQAPTRPHPGNRLAELRERSQAPAEAPEATPSEPEVAVPQNGTAKKVNGAAKPKTTKKKTSKKTAKKKVRKKKA